MDTQNSPHKRPKVVFILPSLAGGGAERVLITLMNELDPAKFDREFLVINEEGPLRDLIAPDIPFHTLGKGLRVGRSLPKLFLKLREIKPDLVVSTMAHMNFALLLLKPFFPKTRFIIREAITLSFFFQKNGLRERTIRSAYKILYPRAHRIMSPAQVIIDEFKDLLSVDAGRYALLHNPVDVESLRGMDEAAGSATKEIVGRVHFICAGRLHPQKGFDRLIEKLPALEMGSDWHLTILGEGEQRPELEALIARHDLKDKVELLGHVARPWPHIARADMFLMPSRWEGLPNVVLEALACGTPVIATRSSGGIEEIAQRIDGDHLMLVDTMDELIAAMKTARHTPSESYRNSLLSEYFYKESVTKRFSEIIEETLAA